MKKFLAGLFLLLALPAHAVIVTDPSGSAVTSTASGGHLGLDINCIAGCAGSGGGSSFSLVDKSAYVYGTGSLVPGGGIYQDTSALLTAGQVGAFRLTANRALHINLRDSSGNEITTLPVSLSAVPLATGAATSAKQDTGNTSLASIDGKIPASPAQDRTTAAAPSAVRLSNGSAFLDPTQIRALTSSDVVTVNNFPATQAVSGSVSVSNLPATQAVSGSVSVSNFPATQAVSIASMPSTPVTNAGTFPVQAALNAETTKVIGTVNVASGQTIAVTNAGTFPTQATLATGSNVIGKVTIDQTTPGTTNLVQVGGSLPTGANTIGAVTNANLDVALSTRLKPADTLAGVTTVGAVTAITNALPTGANKIGTVDIATAAATAKGTQGANAVPTQDLKDAGRSIRTLTLDGFAVAATTETLNTMSYSTDNGTLTTGTSYSVTAGKRLRIQQIVGSIHTIAGNTTAATCIVRIRANAAGAAIVTSPVQYVMALPSTAAANSSAGPVATQFPDGWEFAAATGIGVTTTCPGFVATTAAPKVNLTITTYEY